ncbi:MAG: AI-2E family transporter [Candidatus Absconditabacteria bacterium]
MKNIDGFKIKINSIIKSIASTLTESNPKSETDELIELEKKAISSSKNVSPKGEVRLNGFDIFKFWIIGGVVLYLGYVVFQSLGLIYLIFTAFILSIAMEAIIGLMGKKTNRILAVLVSYFLMIVFFLSGFFIVIPFVLNQSAQIIEILINKVTLFQHVLQDKGLILYIKDSSWIPLYFRNLIINNLQDPEVLTALQKALQENVSNIVSLGTNYLKNVGFWVVKFLTGFVSVLFQVFIVGVIAIFFSLEKDNVISFIARISGNPDYTFYKFLKIYKQLGLRLKGQLILCLFVFFTVGILLWSLSIMPWAGINMPNKFTLALIAGITEFIPMLGPILGAIPAVLVASITFGFKGFVIISILYYIVQAFENNVLVPMVMNQALGVSPLLIFIAMLIGGSVLGFIGIVLSVPIAVILSLFFEKDTSK